MRPARRQLAIALVLATAAAACSTNGEAGNVGATSDAQVPPLVERQVDTADPAREDGNEPVEVLDETAVPVGTTTTTTAATSADTEVGASGGGAAPGAEPEPIEIEIGVDDSELDALLEELDNTLAELLAGMNQSEGEVGE